MNYIETTLQPNETVLDRAKVHWIVFSRGYFALLIAQCFFIYYHHTEPNVPWLHYIFPTAIFTVIGVADIINAAITRWTTEIAITNLRIIYKSGLISRHTLEMNIDKVESVDVTQSILGRFLNYGTVLVRGVGTGLEPVNLISDPLKFRDAVLSHTVAPSAPPAIPPSPTPPPPEPAASNSPLPQAPVFGHRRPAAE